MTRYYSKRNKRKVWAKTYGKPFIARRAVGYARMAALSAQCHASMSIIASSSVDRVAKAINFADVAAKFGEASSELSFVYNRGFVK